MGSNEDFMASKLLFSLFGTTIDTQLTPRLSIRFNLSEHLPLAERKQPGLIALLFTFLAGFAALHRLRGRRRGPGRPEQPVLAAEPRIQLRAPEHAVRNRSAAVNS